MAEITKSTFNGGGSDNVAAVDVYKTITPAVRNTYNKVTSAFGESFDFALSRGSEELRNITKDDIKSLPLRADKTPTEDEQLKDLLKGGKSKINDLAKDSKAYLIETLRKNTGSESIEIDYQGELAKVGVPDIKDADALGSFITDLTGDQLFKVVNTGAKVALIGYVLKELSKFDLGSALESILDKLDPSDAKKAVRSDPKLVITPGNIDTVDIYIQKLGANNLLANYPDIAHDVLRYYKFKEGTIPSQYPALIIQLERVMNALMPNWIETERNGVTVWNLCIINTASDDALTLLKSDSDYFIPAMIAPKYTTREVTTMMREQYPMIALR